MGKVIYCCKRNIFGALTCRILQKSNSLLAFIFILNLICSTVKTITCPSTASVASVSTTQQDSFAPYTPTMIYDVEVGPITGNLYYLYWIPPQSYISIRNIDPSNNLVWDKTFSCYNVSIKGMSVSPDEQFICIANYSGNLVVICLYTSNGAQKEIKY